MCRKYVHGEWREVPLRCRRGRYLVPVAVPRDLREHVGKARVEEKYLGTGDLQEAKRLKHAAVADILAKFERQRSGGPLSETELTSRPSPS